MSDETLPGLVDLTPVNPAFNDDPHALLNVLRDKCPVRRDEAMGVFILSRYADVRGVLSDTTMWRSPELAEPASMFDAALRQGNSDPTIPEDERRKDILLMDEPDHMRIRGPIAKALYKRVAKSKALMQAVIDEKLDAIGTRSPFDAMKDYALLVPVDVIARFIGVDHARLAEFREWSEGVILSLNTFRSEEETEILHRCGEALSEYMRSLMAERRRKPEDDLMSDMVALQAEGGGLTDGEICINLQGLLVGGNLTTTDLIGNAIWLLLKHPGELAKLKADPALINGVVEEVLRYESPVDITGRIAPREMNVQGCPIHPHQSMVMSLRGANRDADVFPDPHRFDITRKDAPHVAFGGGMHLCIGAPLARMEAAQAILSFFQRFPHARLADPDMKPEWRTLPFFRGLKELPISA
ncbi:MAG: cytochrome P450 [Rhizomicrobium sp.]